MEVARMFAHGASQAEVARTFGVSPQAASSWYRRWHQGGEAALRGAGRAGRRPRLSAAELEAVAEALRKGPEAFGFDTELWTLASIAAAIEQLTGCATTPGMCGGCCAGSAGARSGPPAARSSATRPRSPAGGPKSGPGSKGGAEPRRLALLPGRVQLFATSAGAAHLGAQRADPDLAAPHPLEAGLHGRDLLLPAGRVAGPAVLP
jgi:hypothetical protein